MWVLIGTYWIVNGYGAISMTTAEFNNEQACRYAGASQEVALRQDLKLKTNGRYTFVCVKKD